MLSIEQLQTTSLMHVQVTPDCAKGLVFFYSCTCQMYGTSLYARIKHTAVAVSIEASPHAVCERQAIRGKLAERGRS